MQSAKIAYTRRKHFITSIWRTKGRHYQSGVELLELLIVLAIMGVVAFIAIPMYTSYRDKVNVATAVADITTIEQDRGCVYITGPDENLTMITDEFLFKLIGIE